jgi:hypothetical protein
MYADPNGDRSGKSYIVFGKANNSAPNTTYDLPAFELPLRSDL